MRVWFTEAIVRNAAPPIGKNGKPISQRVGDEHTQELYLRISPKGAKSYAVVHYVHGVAKYHSLGRPPSLKVEEARARARAFAGNPIAALKEASSLTFGDASRKWFAEEIEDRKNPVRTGPEIQRMLNVYILPRWEKLKLEKIGKTEISALEDSVKKGAAARGRRGERQAQRVLSLVKQIMTWYESKVDDYRAPAFKRRRATNKNDAIKRALDDNEVRALWHCTHDMGTYGRFVRIALLTGQRREKVQFIKRSDINADGVWTVGIAHATEKSHIAMVKLPELAFGIIKKQPQQFGNPYLFPATGKADRPFSGFNKYKKKLDGKMTELLAKAQPPIKFKPWRFHDLRHTARTLMSTADVDKDIAEQVLGHAGDFGDYYNHDDLQRKKSTALETLSQQVQAVLAGKSSRS